MRDFKLDENFEIVIGPRNDVEMVEGREAFEQALALWLHQVMYEEVGELTGPETIRLLEISVSETAKQLDYIDELRSVTITQSETVPGEIDLSIVYLTGEGFDLTL